MGTVRGKRLDALKGTIKETAEAMNVFGDIDNSYDDGVFKINV